MNCVLTHNISFLSAKQSSRALSQLRHISFVKFSEVFHLARSDIFTTSSRSVLNCSSLCGNCNSDKKSICWINKAFSNSRSYHSCIGSLTNPSCVVNYQRKPVNFNQVRKMVWISDLDDPKVQWQLGFIAWWSTRNTVELAQFAYISLESLNSVYGSERKGKIFRRKIPLSVNLFHVLQQGRAEFSSLLTLYHSLLYLTFFGDIWWVIIWKFS